MKHLRSLGVQFKFGHRLIKFVTDGENNKVMGAVVLVTDIESKETKSERIPVDDVESTATKTERIQADEYVLAITPFASAKVVAQSDPPIQSDREMRKFAKLIQDGPHIQISFRIGFSEKVSFQGYKHQAFIMRDSEFNLTLFPSDAIFPADIGLGPDVQSLWTGTACCAYVPGELFGQSASQCTREQFTQEVLHQLFRSKSLDEMIARANGGRSLKSFKISRTEVWHDWQFPEVAVGYKHVTAPQPKWVTSCKTHPFQPNCDTEITNLKLAGSHTRTDADLWSMEGACESGRRAAFAIVSKSGDVQTITGPKLQRTPLMIRIFWKMDNALWALGLPSLADVLFFLLFLICILAIVVTPTVIVLSRK